MIDIKATLDYLLAQDSETEVLEFKHAARYFVPDKMGKYFSALSNEANLMGKEDTWLVFGIRDHDKAIIGTQFRTDNKQLQNLKADIANHTTHRITFKDIHELTIDKHKVILFQIPPAPKGMPIAWKGHFYGRDGEQLNALNIEELERTRQQYKEEDWSIGICHKARLSDLSEEAILKAKQLYTIKNPKLSNEIQLWDDITFLNKAKLCIKGKITRTCHSIIRQTRIRTLYLPCYC